MTTAKSSKHQHHSAINAVQSSSYQQFRREKYHHSVLNAQIGLPTPPLEYFHQIIDNLCHRAIQSAEDLQQIKVQSCSFMQQQLVVNQPLICDHPDKFPKWHQRNLQIPKPQPRFVVDKKKILPKVSNLKLYRNPVQDQPNILSTLSSNESRRIKDAVKRCTQQKKQYLKNDAQISLPIKLEQNQEEPDPNSYASRLIARLPKYRKNSIKDKVRVQATPMRSLQIQQKNGDYYYDDNGKMHRIKAIYTKKLQALNSSLNTKIIKVQAKMVDHSNLRQRRQSSLKKLRVKARKTYHASSLSPQFFSRSGPTGAEQERSIFNSFRPANNHQIIFRQDKKYHQSLHVSPRKSQKKQKFDEVYGDSIYC